MIEIAIDIIRYSNKAKIAATRAFQTTGRRNKTITNTSINSLINISTQKCVILLFSESPTFITVFEKKSRRYLEGISCIILTFLVLSKRFHT
jgi:hypothetical protein